MMRSWWAGLISAAIWATAAAAAPYDDATRLFDNGKYLQAASLAARADTASGLALAARAMLAHAVYVAKRPQRAAEVERGANLAKKALAKNSRHVEAHLQLVIAFYQKSRATTALDAYFQSYADKSSEHLSIAREIEPDNPWVYWLLGGWNYEVVRLAGPILADTLFDANLAAGRAAFSKAIALLSHSVVLHYSFARALLTDDPDLNRTEAVQELERALAVKQLNHLDKIIASRARTVLDAVRSGSPDALRRALEPDG